MSDYRDAAQPTLNSRGATGWARLAVIGFLVCTLIALFFSAQLYLAYSQYNDSVTWWLSLRASLGIWYSWGLLVWLVYWVSVRFPLGGSRWRRHTLIHVVGALTVSVFHAVLCASWYCCCWSLPPAFKRKRTCRRPIGNRI